MIYLDELGELMKSFKPLSITVIASHFTYGMNLNNGISGVMKIDMTSMLAECIRYTIRLQDVLLVTHCHIATG